MLDARLLLLDAVRATKRLIAVVRRVVCHHWLKGIRERRDVRPRPWRQRGVSTRRIFDFAERERDLGYGT
jgi:hypothetical protein